MKFTGPLDPNKGTPEVRKALRAYYNQVNRCTQKTNKRFKNYGAKGIRVEYGSRDFVGWYLSELSKNKLKNPSVGRIDHGKNYSFDNIRLEEFSDNSRDAIARAWKSGAHKHVNGRSLSINFENSVTGEKLEFESLRAAAKHFGVYIQSVMRWRDGGKIRFARLKGWTVKT